MPNKPGKFDNPAAYEANAAGAEKHERSKDVNRPVLIPVDPEKIPRSDEIGQKAQTAVNQESKRSSRSTPK